MDGEKFYELFVAMRGEDDPWPDRERRIKETLRELLEGEFIGIEARRFQVRFREIPKHGIVFRNAHVITGDPVIIYFDNRYFTRYPEIDRGDIRDLKEVLRHELLHVELDMNDADPVFRLEAKRRGIRINGEDDD
jgi:hypothetical protein